jgi:protocatechuate 3,4-dioxygenase beta subunit
LYESGALRWTLTDANGIAIPGVDCQLAPDDPRSAEKPRSGRTDPGGLWVVRGLYPGSYTARANTPGKETATIHFEAVAHQNTVVVTKME